MSITDRRGSALLTVLWLSAALGAIAFSLANTVRGETERTSNAVDGAKAYYLAVGGIHRAILHSLWGKNLPQPNPYFITNAPYHRMEFPGGEVIVEMIPESSKFNINTILPEDLYKLLMNLGLNPEHARNLTLAIDDWRKPSPTRQATSFEQSYVAQFPSFRPHHASLEEIEELLFIQGMTPELYYGTYMRASQDPGAPLVRRGGLRACVSVFGSNGPFDINTVEPAVMAAVNIPPDLISAIVNRRRTAPFLTGQDITPVIAGGAPGVSRLKLGGNSIYTFRATARPRTASGELSDLRRSVAAMVKFMPGGFEAPYHILRWYDSAN